MNRFSHRFFSRISLSIAVLLGCCAVLILSSCSKKTSANIIGKWQMQGEASTIEFRKDGTLTISHNTGPAVGDMPQTAHIRSPTQAT